MFLSDEGTKFKFNITSLGAQYDSILAKYSVTGLNRQKLQFGKIFMFKSAKILNLKKSERYVIFVILNNEYFKYKLRLSFFIFQYLPVIYCFCCCWFFLILNILKNRENHLVNKYVIFCLFLLITKTSVYNIKNKNR